MENQYIRLINRSHPLPPSYVPKQLIDIGLPFDADTNDPKRLLEKRTARAARELFCAASAEGLSLYGVSGYRSYERQTELYTGSPYVAPPGTSEHQSGLALDVSCPQIKLELTEEFADTPEGVWLFKNASLFGFILRYPQNKTPVTQVPYEPWHIRYVTKPLATYLSLTATTLEEYHALQDNQILLS